jgi:hypothetical protein
MSDIEQKSRSAEKADALEGQGCVEQSADELRRDFMKRFGAYAAGSAVGLYVLMTAKNSVAASDGGP